MRLCLIGCGEHARAVHGPAQARCARERPGLVLAACCDLDRARAESHAAEFGFARAYSDPRAMLDAEKPGAVVVVVPVTATVAVEVDRLAAAADAGGRDGRPVPHQVAFNRRFAPLLRELRRRIESAGPLQHLHYELTRVERRDPDFSITAIHGIDAVRFLAGSDYAEARFRYRELPEVGAGVANILVGAVMASGATAHLAFCPVAGVLVERATVHAQGHSFFLQVPMWDGADSPRRLLHFENGTLVADLSGETVGDGIALFERGGFYREYAAFLDDVEGGRPPSPGFRESRQSVEMAERIRGRSGSCRF
jgi:predicted dehydrogenase